MKEMSCKTCRFCYTDADDYNPCTECDDYSLYAEDGESASETKIKEDLMKLIKEKERDIANLHAEIDKLEKYRVFQEGADTTKALHTAFMNSGFSDEQAFDLVEIMLKNSFKFM